MTRLAPEDRRLLALAVVFAPNRAEVLASRFANDPRGLLREAATRAARRTRGDRLASLRDEVIPLREPAPLDGSALAAERPETVAAIRRHADADRGGRPEGARPALRRLLLERATRARG